MNLKIKFRESFRPFAPSVLYEKAPDYFDIDHESPYMLLVANVKKAHLKSDNKLELKGFDRLNAVRSDIPAVTHVDNSARIQTVSGDTHNGIYYDLLREFYNKTGCPAIINTSFNVRGEPIVCTPEDAYRCFMRTDMDYLVIGSFILDKKSQPERMHESGQYFELD
jgi:carbamoyltransferase